MTGWSILSYKRRLSLPVPGDAHTGEPTRGADNSPSLDVVYLTSFVALTKAEFVLSGSVTDDDEDSWVLMPKGQTLFLNVDDPKSEEGSAEWQQRSLASHNKNIQDSRPLFTRSTGSRILLTYLPRALNLGRKG